MSAGHTVSQVIADLVKLANDADRAGQDSIHGAAFAAALMLVDAASDDGVAVDRDAFGFMSGVIEG